MGLQTLEVPLSRLCETETFLWFVLCLLTHGEKLTKSYNSRLAEYRKVHRLRSPAQPLPDLAIEEGWHEAPFWLWTPNDHSRRALWWRKDGYDLLLRDSSSQRIWTLDNALRRPTLAIKELDSLSKTEFSIRPRALANSMFLRLFGCDSFIHGIGGAKYDQITDLIMFDLFNAFPPQFIALSQTTVIPTGAELVTPKDLGRKRRILREMHFHPEAFLDKENKQFPQVSSIAKKKSKWIEYSLPRGERLDRHREIEAANVELRKYLQETTENEKKILSSLELRFAASKVLGSREWSYCLFPIQFLKERLLDLNGSSS